MAKGKSAGDETPARSQRTGTSSSTRDKSKPEKDTSNEDMEDLDNSGGDGGNPDWWRGDPGRSGEVL